MTDRLNTVEDAHRTVDGVREHIKQAALSLHWVKECLDRALPCQQGDDGRDPPDAAIRAHIAHIERYNRAVRTCATLDQIEEAHNALEATENLLGL
jgi:hypothetical protein